MWDVLLCVLVCLLCFELLSVWVICCGLGLIVLLVSCYILLWLGLCGLGFIVVDSGLCILGLLSGFAVWGGAAKFGYEYNDYCGV